MSIYYVCGQKIFFSDRLTFIRSRTSRRIYRLALPLHAPETLSSLSKSRISINSDCVTIRHALLLKIEIHHFDGPVFLYTLRAPRQYTSFYLARNSRAGEVESLRSSTLRSLLILMLDWSNLQTFQRWKPYLYPVFYQSIPETRAPEVETEEGKAGVYKELALF